MSKNVGTTNKKGFTIIEVVLVLAIAGLIFLIVFLAVPALQRSRRDTQRRSDISRFIAQMESYSANNNGAYPTSSGVSSFVNDYMDTFNDPSTGSTYDVTFGITAPAAEGDISYRTEAKCGTGGAITADTGKTRNIAAAVFVEDGGAYCQDNQ